MNGVLCSGSIIHDTLVRPVEDPLWGTTTVVETIEFHTGGNGANTSIALACLGTPVRLLGAVGRDEQSRLVLDALRRAGVDTAAVAQVNEPTAATIALVNAAGDRKFLHRLGASAIVFDAPIEFGASLIEGMTHYHLASIFLLPKLRPRAGATLARARAAGLTTSLDTNWDPRGIWMGDIAPCLPHLDFLFMNEDEARMVTGAAAPAAAAGAVLARGLRTAVLKLGARGCAIYTGGREILCPAFEVTPKDTTGAGDCFVGGFLSASLAGATLADAGRFANAVAAHTVQCVGGSSTIPDRAAIEQWMRTAPLRR